MLIVLFAFDLVLGETLRAIPPLVPAAYVVLGLATAASFWVHHQAKAKLK